jgi:hypothetical protein
VSAKWDKMAYLGRLCRGEWRRCRGVLRGSTGLAMTSSAVRVMWLGARRRREQISDLEESLHMHCGRDT